MASAVTGKQNGMVETAFDVANRETESLDESQIFWWGLLGHSLATLLKDSQYSIQDQLYYLRWFQQWILRSLGPRPINGQPYHPSTFTHDGSPVEFSLNWKEKKFTQTVRFTTEPLSQDSGRTADPLNQVPAQQLLTAMAKTIPGIDLTRFNLLLEETNVPHQAAEDVLAKIPPGHPKVRVVVAYDLEDGTLVPKAYFNLEPKAIHMGTSPSNVVFDALSKCNGPFGSYDASAEVLRSYLASRDGPGGPQVYLLSHDCVADSPRSRAKVYVMTPITTLAAALDAFSIGGALSGPVIEGGLQAVRSFWRHTFDTDVEDRVVLPAGSRCIFVYEMRPMAPNQQGPNIEVKMHMPGLWLGQTDTKVCEVLSTWFQKHGHSDFGARYQTSMASAL